MVLPSVNTLKNKVGKIQLNTFAKVSRVEIKISTNNWELPWGMMEYLHRYMSHYVSDNKFNTRILVHNPVSSIIKRTPIIDYYIQKSLVEKKKTFTINHEDSLKSIPQKIRNVFGPLLHLWQIINNEK